MRRMLIRRVLPMSAAQRYARERLIQAAASGAATAPEFEPSPGWLSGGSDHADASTTWDQGLTGTWAPARRLCARRVEHALSAARPRTRDRGAIGVLLADRHPAVAGADVRAETLAR